MKPLGDSPAFKSLLTSFENPFLSYFVAVIFTMIVQSCDATVGIIQALAMTTGVNYAVCIPMICGAQIGTCITSIISSIGTSRNGRRAAFLHLFYNIIKTVSFMAIYVVLNSIFHFPFLSMSASLVGIALIHSLINVAYSAFILPMSGLLVKLVNFVLPQTESEKDIDQVVSTLDPMLLKTAPFAIVQAKKVADMMARMVADIFTEIRGSVQKEDGNWEEVEKQCDMVLLYHDKLTDYMLKIGEDSLSNADSRRLMMVKDASTDLATIIKLYQSIYRSLRQIDRETYQFPKQSMGDIAVLFSAMEEVISLTTNGFQRDNPTFLKAIPAFREVIHSMKEIIVHKSIRLMQEGVYTYDQHTFVSETTHQFDRIIGFSHEGEPAAGDFACTAEYVFINGRQATEAEVRNYKTLLAGSTFEMVKTANGTAKYDDKHGIIVIHTQEASTAQDDDNPLILINGHEVKIPANIKTIDNASIAKLLNLNEDDIESITVLKDGAATAIYGDKGKNGVIEIKLKEANQISFETIIDRLPGAEKHEDGSITINGKPVKKILLEGQEVYNNDDPIFEVVEEPAQYPGGQAALMQFLAQNIRYPKIAAENGAQGRVLVQFVIEKDGSLSNFAVVKKSGDIITKNAQSGITINAQGTVTEENKIPQEAFDALNAEAVRVLREMPKWIPAKQRGQVVRLKYTLPVTFRLQ